MEKPLKGIVVFYVSTTKDAAIDYNRIIDLARENHIDVISSMKNNGWETMFVPCVGESGHASKVEVSDEEGSGCIIVYMNINAEDNADGINVSTLIESSKENHMDLIGRMKEIGWEVMFMPCTGEGGRVEKVNFEEVTNDV